MRDESAASRPRLAGPALILVAALAACAEPAATFGECEEGVSEISRSTEMVPSC